MTMIVKIFKTYVSLGNLGLSQREVGFPFGIRILSCPGEQLKHFFPMKQSCPLGKKSLNYPKEQF